MKLNEMKSAYNIMKKLASIFCAALMLAACGQKYPVKTKVPARAPGQESVLQLRAEPIANVRIAVVGLGDRGGWAVQRLVHVPGCSVVAVCDVEPDRVAASSAFLSGNGYGTPDEYVGIESYKELCKSDKVDLVYICTDWIHHVPVALAAMDGGKHVAIEVPSATTLEECWALVDKSEQTRRHCAILENCCYDFFEMSALAMAQAGLFGEIVHAEGAYLHCLENYWDGYWNNWRLDFNRKYRGDVYATHGLGPVAQALNIHRGDRFKTLVAMDTDAFTGRKLTGDTSFANGDQTSTLIRTEKGKTVLIEHDVMTPRPYNRMYQLVGTDGYAGKYPVEEILLRADKAEEAVNAKDITGHEPLSAEQMEALFEKYPSPVITPELKALAQKVGGHGGMDFIMDYRLIYCLNNGLPLDEDVYDLAEWSCIGELSRISIENGCAPVEFPDFTRGDWNKINGFSYAFAE